MSQVTDPGSLEPQLESLLLRWVPNMSSRWQSTSQEDMEVIVHYAGGRLPNCYEWMLRRLAGGFASIGFGALDFSARTLIDGHRRGLFPHHEGMTCIAVDTSIDQPQLRYYDLAHQKDGDAMVFIAGPEEGEIEPEFQTLRELIGTAAFDNFRLSSMPFRCKGLLETPGDQDVAVAVLPLLEAQDFRPQVPCGPFCLLYDNGSAAFSSFRSPAWPPTTHVMPFALGATSSASLRSIMGHVAAATDVKIRNIEWLS